MKSMSKDLGREPAQGHACISAISENFNFSYDKSILENSNFIYDTSKLFPGYKLHVYPLYVEFVDKDYPESKEDLTWDTSLDVPLALRKKRQKAEDLLTFFEFNNPDIYEEKLYPKPKDPSINKVVPTRGQIRGMSKKSSLRLRKRASRVDDLALWIDLTFADDVMVDKSISERASSSYYNLKRLTKYVKDTFGMHLIWKREYKPRKSGENIGEVIPHFHVLFGGMSQDQKSKWCAISIQILMQWVKITGTTNDRAIEVAVHRKSFRRIENPKHATCYISKYFSKDEPIDLPEGETIGRCWGTSSNCPDVKPHIVDLTQEESFKLTRHMIRKKKLPKGSFVRYQLQHGHQTFLFEDQQDLFRFLDSLIPF